MDKFKIDSLGGIDFNLDDLSFMDNAYRDAIFNILSGFAFGVYPNFIISGCQASNLVGGGYSIAAGYVFMNCEVLKCDGGTVGVLGAGQVYAFVLNVSYDAAGSKVNEDFTTHDTYQVRRAVPSIVSTPVLSTQLDLMGDRLEDRIMNLINKDFTNLASFASGFAAGAAMPGVRIENKNIVRLSGNIIYMSGSYNAIIDTQIAVLSPQFHPTYDRYVSIISNFSANNKGILKINTSGQLIIMGSICQFQMSSGGLFLDGVTFPL